MKLFLFFSLIFVLANCSKPKTVLICGDHICVNKNEAEQFFEENLTIEVKIMNKKIKKKTDLVELNLRKNDDGSRGVEILAKNETNNDLKVLSKDEKIKIMKNVNNKKKERKITNKKISKDIVKKQNKDKKVANLKINELKDKKTIQNNVNKDNKEIVDVCTILEKCNIEEISKFLLKQSKNKSFPDITVRK